MITTNLETAVAAVAIAVPRERITAARAALSLATDGLALDDDNQLAALNCLCLADEKLAQAESLAAQARHEAAKASRWLSDPSVMRDLFAPPPTAATSETDGADEWKNAT